MMIGPTKYRWNLTEAQALSMIERNNEIHDEVNKDFTKFRTSEPTITYLKRYYPHILDIRDKGHHARDVQSWINENATAPHICIFQTWAFDSADDAFHFKMRFG